MSTATYSADAPFSEAPEMKPYKDFYKLQPLRALRALDKLIADKEDTKQVFEILQALSGRSIPKNYARMMETPTGGVQAYQRPELAEKFGDDAWLAQFPPGTVGHAYRTFITRENISAAGLAEESRKTLENDIDAEHPLAWMGRRMRDTHDVWHILTGYSRDALGEACLVAFTYAQSGSAGLALIAYAGANEISKKLPNRPIRKAVWQGYQNGKKANWLPAQDYEKLFATPLDVARKRLNIAEPSVYLSVPEVDRTEAMTLPSM